MADGMFYYNPIQLENKQRPYADTGYWSNNPHEWLSADRLIGMINECVNMK